MAYTLLSELEYLDPIKHCIIDPMHNLFLGTAKRIFKKIWIPKGLLSDKDLKEIQARVDSVVVPSTIGRIPKKIASAFGGFTAEQWMNWTLVYSLYALRGLIPKEHYECWESFVIACRLLSLPVLTDLSIKKADLLLVHFCRKVELLYGKNEITPNMHLHCHLVECVCDYGPIFGFWLFSFERYNGMLGKFPNNQKHIEIQLMQRFETEMQLYSLSLPQQFHDSFYCAFKRVTGDASKVNSYDPQTYQAKFALYHFSNGNLRDADPMLLLTPTWTFPRRYTMKVLHTNDLVQLSQALRHLFAAHSFIPDINRLPTTIRSYKRIEFGVDSVFSVHNDSRYGRHSFVLASWAGNDGDIDVSYGLRPGRIQLIFLYRFYSAEGSLHSLPMAKIEWYKAHPQKADFGVGLEVWNRYEFEHSGPSSFVPIACVRCKFAPAYGSIKVPSSTGHAYESVLFICPLRCRTFV